MRETVGERLARKLLFNWGPALAYMALIWWLSSQRLHLRTELVPLRDKGLHFAEYACLGGVLCRATLLTWPTVRVRASILAALTTFAWGVLDELHQAFIPGRTADLMDLVADFVGALVGVSTFFVAWWTVRRFRARRAAQGTG